MNTSQLWILSKGMKSMFFLLTFLSAISYSVQAQPDSVITVGIEASAPFVNMYEGKLPEGLSVDFWNLVEDDAQIKFEYKTYDEFSTLLEAIKSGEVDMSINPITVTDGRMREMEFSQPFFISGTTVARKYDSGWMEVIKNIFSWQFFSAVAVLLTIISFFGVLIWYFERKKNKDQFGDGLKGLGDGFWWSAVTMTTVGYGDKAPVTKGGRVVGFIWMFAGIIMISSLTAGIASALTVQSLDSKIDSPEDLRRFKVGTISGSSTAEYLELFNIDYKGYPSVLDALESLGNDEVELIVYDRPILRYYLQEAGHKDIVVAPKDLKTDYYSFSYPKNSRLATYLDPYVVKTLKSPEWSFRLKNNNDDE